MKTIAMTIVSLFAVSAFAAGPAHTTGHAAPATPAATAPTTTEVKADHPECAKMTDAAKKTECNAKHAAAAAKKATK